MIKSSLQNFVNHVVAAGRITLTDVRRLQREVLPDGVEDRDEADVLIALDRAVATKHVAWNAVAIQSVVDYVVWTSRPTGFVDAETARWLVASLEAGRGPTPVAEAIAFEVVREAERADAALVGFVMRSVEGRLAAATASADLDLAA